MVIEAASRGPAAGSGPSAAEIKDVLKDDLRGMPLGEFEHRLGIEEAVYDEVYTNQPGHSRRLYHLEGFCIDVSVEHRDAALYTDSHFYPGVGEDGLSRPQRMEAYEDALAENFAPRQKRLDAAREKRAASNRADVLNDE